MTTDYPGGLGGGGVIQRKGFLFLIVQKEPSTKTHPKRQNALQTPKRTLNAKTHPKRQNAP